MRSKHTHRLRTIEDLARHLGISIACLERVLSELDFDETNLYRSWEQPKKSGGTRPIDTPKEILKFVQRRIKERLLQRTEISKVAIGGVRGRRLKDNLVPHLQQPMVANFDLKSFFSNITNRQVYALYINTGIAPDVAKILTRLTTFKGRIPQGAPTSPMLSNLVAGYGGRSCLDGRLQRLCLKNKFRIGRWIDDISVSGSAYLKRFEPTIECIIEQSGFIPNRDKTVFASKDEAQVITKHLVNVKPNVSRQERKRLRAVLHRCNTLGPEKVNRGEVEKFKNHIRGKIAHLASINPETGRELLRDFNSIQWPTS